MSAEHPKRQETRQQMLYRARFTLTNSTTPKSKGGPVTLALRHFVSIPTYRQQTGISLYLEEVFIFLHE